MDLAARLHGAGSDDDAAFEAENWVDREIGGCDFRDERLAKRFRIVLRRIGSAMGQSIPLVSQDWANTKA
jgi:hypothetical protein